MISREFIIVGIMHIDGVAQLAGECDTILAESVETAKEIFLEKRETDTASVTWELFVQEDY